MGIELRGKNGAIDLKVPIKQIGGAVDSVNGMTGDVVLTANDVGAIDKYNGMTPVECVFPPLFDGGSEISRIFYVKQGVINPVDYKTVTDDIKTAWINLTFLTDATVGKLSSYQSNIKGIAPLIEIGVFGEDFFNTVTYNSPCVFFDDPITQRKKITIYTHNASKKSFSVIVDGPNGFYATDAYSILNDEFIGGRVYDQHLRPYSNNANDTNSKLGQLEMAAAPTKDMQIATKKYVDDSVSNPLNITSATVGQIAKITAVDDSGKPTSWSPVDMPSGGGAQFSFDLIVDHTVTAEDLSVSRLTWTNETIQDLGKYNLFYAAIESDTEFGITKWVKFYINNSPVSQFAGASNPKCKIIPATCNRFFGKWIGTSVYNPVNSVPFPVLVGPCESVYQGGDALKSAEDARSIAIGSYAVDFGLAEGMRIKVYAMI